MKKIVLFILCLIPISVSSIALPDTYSDKVLLYDLTEDKLLLEKNSDERANIASLTKIMTTITAIEEIPDLEKEVTITSDMLAGIPYDASVAGLNIGETFSARDLLYASILPSGADATQALAFTSSNGIAAFVEKMNTLAEKIGAKNTHFVNVTGLDIENHYSTASDILLILKYALQNPTFKEIYCTKEYTLANGKTINATIKVYNRLMNLDTSRILGSKTGYTSKAGVCIAALISTNGHEVLIITMGAPYVYGNFYNLKDALALTQFLDSHFQNQNLMTTEDTIIELPVSLSKTDMYKVHPNENITKYLPKDFDNSLFDYQYNGKEKLSFRDKEQSKLGTIKYFYNGELIKEEELFLKEDLKISWKKVVKKYGYILIVILILLLYIQKRRKHNRKKRRGRKSKNNL